MINLMSRKIRLICDLNGTFVSYWKSLSEDKRFVFSFDQMSIGKVLGSFQVAKNYIRQICLIVITVQVI